MSFRSWTVKLRRQCYVILVCGILSCVAMIMLLSTCNTTADSVERYQKSSHTGTRADTDHTNYSLHTNLLLVVISAPDHAHIRQVIRTTWASDLPKGAHVRFVMGTQGLQQDSMDLTTEEQIKYQDLIILDNFEESYKSLTLKVLSTFKWVNQNIKFNFLMKLDEDSFVRVDKVLDELLKKPQKRLYWGFFDGRAHVKKSGKWQEKDFVLCDRYLPYALGGGYVISSDLVDYLAVNSEYLQMFKSEDVSVGTWLGPLNIHRVHDPNFDTEYKSRGCFNSYIVTHKKSTADMQQLYSNLRTKHKLCETETRLRLSYEYNWDNLPTKCCERIDPSVP